MAANVNRASVGIFKRAWHEMPEIVGSSFMGLVGIGLCIAANIYYYQNDMDNRPYKTQYTVYRHDDPRVPNIKKPADLTSK